MNEKKYDVKIIKKNILKNTETIRNYKMPVESIIKSIKRSLKDYNKATIDDNNKNTIYIKIEYKNKDIKRYEINLKNIKQLINIRNKIENKLKGYKIRLIDRRFLSDIFSIWFMSHIIIFL